jgi:hypothetical protein
VTVVDVPNPLPSPVFVSPLSTCMSMLRLDGLVPGATVIVRQGPAVVGKLVVSQPSEFVPIEANASLTSGARLEAIQELTLPSGTNTSPPVLSLPITFTNREEQLPPPGIVQPVTACRTSLDFVGMTPSADVRVENEGQTAGWFNVASAYNGWGAPPLKQGKLVAVQRFPRCNRESGKTVVPVGPTVAPGVPTIQANPCPKVGRVQLANLVPNAVVVLSTVVPDPLTAGAVVITAIGEATASSTSEPFDLPADIAVTSATGDPVKLTATQTLCGLASPPSAYVGFAVPAGPYPAPKITPPLLDCARRLMVTGAHPSSSLQAIYADTRAPIADATLAIGADQIITPWFPLAAGHDVVVKQIGCDADGDSPKVHVDPLPSPLPAPTIVAPVRPSASGVTVKGCLPGARVHLLVNGVVRNSIDTFIASPTIPVGALALVEGNALWVVQTLCAATSNLEGHATIVAKGQMKIDVSPGTAQRGSVANVTVSARDADTGDPIVGAQVLLDGKVVGQTGTAFTFKPVAGQPNPAGLVKEPVAHFDASFSITLTDPPPKPKGRLSLNVGPTTLIPDVLRLVSANWTVTTLWTPTQTITASGAHTSVTLPDPPPPPADQRVSVKLVTTWEVAGYINGVPFPYQQFPGHMHPDPTLIAWAGKDITAGWLVLWSIEGDGNGNALLVVVTNFQSAV